MITTRETSFEKDAVNKTLVVTREFDAPLDQVWRAWTESELLDQWWAPRPWKAKTKTMDFRDGGSWLYAMEGPNGEQHWSRADFEKVEEGKSFTSVDCFCDENGIRLPDLPGMRWTNNFSRTASGTMVRVVITFTSEADMDKIIEMGFKEGFAMAHRNLDELLER